MLVPPLPAYGACRSPPTAGATRRRVAAGAFATITPRAVVVLVGIGSFVVAIAIAPLVGTEFIPDADNSYIQLNVTLPVGTSLARGSDKLQQVEDLVRAMPEVRMVSTTIGDTGNGQRNSALLGIQLSQAARAQAHARRRSRRRLRKALQPIPGIEVSVGNLPIYVALLGPDPRRSRPR